MNIFFCILKLNNNNKILRNKSLYIDIRHYNLLYNLNKNKLKVSILKNGTYNQGCSTSSFDLKPYNATGKCDVDNCNHPNLSCLGCSKCVTPTTSHRVLCTGKQKKCFVRIEISYN